MLEKGDFIAQELYKSRPQRYLIHNNFNTNKRNKLSHFIQDGLADIGDIFV